ncbi:metallophosphoesterase [Luteimonas sp. 8-5]|uniref:metallophosphoesterase n=1 Tax=Luteimonas sp. 8-5 TaxID=3039387 RepID=UPI00243634FE|nr:metallophosphoesterase [Luteimonas sp. 8-5]MDG6347560.1 metallophosphoesterase [Luteimonas sp. 8-5]
MKVTFLHISDVHFCPGAEEQRPSFFPFLKDIEVQLSRDVGPRYLVFSGDVAKAGSEVSHYDALLEHLAPALDAVGIPKENRICVPGNHDVCTASVKAFAIDHEEIVSKAYDEKAFNDAIESLDARLKAKFANYLDFQAEFAEYGVREDSLAGNGFTLPEGIDIFLVNTALHSSGGLRFGDQKIPDLGRLHLPTRQIAKWLEAGAPSVRLLIGHHPPSWWSAWSQREFEILRRQITMAMFGHMHSQNVTHSREYGSNLVQLFAPALLTDKRDPMGYATVTVLTESGHATAAYRQWDGRSAFVLGTVMAGNDSGVAEFGAPLESSPIWGLVRHYEASLEFAMTTYGKQPKWIEPVVKEKPETAADRKDAVQVSIEDLLSSSESTIVKAPPQFGLSCLGISLCLQACRSGQAWLRIDLASVKPHNVHSDFQRQCVAHGIAQEDVQCIVLDSWSASANNAFKCVEKLSREYPDKRILILETQDQPSIAVAGKAVIAGRNFRQLYLWSLSRTDLRDIVSGYSPTAEDDCERILSRLIADLDTLNLPRTALNSLMLLMVAEVEIDDSPVNRAEVIKRILHLIFSSTQSLTYKSRADLKDCEYLLGAFAEKIITSGNDFFTSDEFAAFGKGYNKQKLVDIDFRLILKLLLSNNIIVSDEDGQLRFRFAYWVHYFGAVRMHHERSFATYILSEMRYTRFPEVVEFYTGIDRRRDDAVEVLRDDLTKLCEKVERVCGLATPAELYALGRWDPTEADVIKLQSELEEKVLGSSLPKDVKDRFLDRTYDPARPYDQQIARVMSAYSYNNLCAGVRAGSRALRNSEHVTPELKLQLLSAIMRCWEQIQTVLVVISPTLASTGQASFDGTKFRLVGHAERKEESPEQAISRILAILPENVLSWFRSDITSSKLGPLLYRQLADAQGGLSQHNLAMLIAAIKPPGWRAVLEQYIAGVGRNSFFLWHIQSTLFTDCRFEYLEEPVKQDAVHLIKMALAKHETGSRRPGQKLLKKVELKEFDKESAKTRG